MKAFLGDALKDSAVVVTTLVSDNLTKIVEDFGDRTGLQYINLMSQFMDIVHQKRASLHCKGWCCSVKLNQEYFDRVAAIEFAVKYDDGKDAKGFLEADLVYWVFHAPRRLR